MGNRWTRASLRRGPHTGTAARLSVSAVMGVRVESGTAIAGPGEPASVVAPAQDENPPAGAAAGTGDEEERW